jgi:hypothetical protein
MLFRQEFLDGIRRGVVTLAFRRWRRPSVKAGGTLLTPIGKLHIGAIDRVRLGEISVEDARRAGYKARDTLLSELQERSDGDIYRIELGPLRKDPRIALRESSFSEPGEAESVLQRLKRLDARAAAGPWTLPTLKVLNAHPGVRAGDLCRLLNQEKEEFKLNVRKLKALGLTESLDVGYRLSPRGQALLERAKDGR